MAENLATLGLIVDATGARREISLTAEQLKALANGGKQAREELAKITAPLKSSESAFKANYTAGMTWMQFVQTNMAAATKQLGDFGRASKELAAQWRALGAGMKPLPSVVPPGGTESVNRYTDAIRKMRIAAAQGQANAMASMISAADPFQKAASVAEQAAVAAGRGAINFGRLRESLTGVAMAAAGTSGPMGSLASTLGMMVVGAPLMVGVLAGVTALGFVWDALTSKTRAAREESKRTTEYLNGLAREQKFGAFGDPTAAFITAGGDLARIRAQIADKTQQAAAGGPRVGALARELRELGEQEREKVRLITAASNEILRIDRERKDEIARKAKEAADKEIAEIERIRKARRDLVEFQGGLIDAKNPLPDLRMMRVGGVAAPGQIDQSVFQSLTRTGNSAAIALAVLTRAIMVNAAVTRDEALRKGRNQIAGSSALSLLSTFGGEAGGMLSSVIGAGQMGLMAGGPQGMAIAGVTALATGIFSLGQSSKLAAEQMRQLQVSVADTVLSWKAELGLPGADKALGEARIRAQTEDARRALLQSMGGPAALWLNPTKQAEYQQRLDEINRLERERLKALGMEAEAIDKVNRSMLNMVDGYKVQSVFFQASRGRAAGASENLTVNVTLPSGEVLATTVLRDFRRRAQAQYGDSGRWSEVR